MRFFISDTHFGHRNIVLGTSQWTDKSGCRDFPTVEAHDFRLIELINHIVEPEDELWHLGDFSFGGKDKIRDYRDRLNCKTIHIVYGNHDHHIQQDWKKYGFASGQHYKELMVGKLPVVLMHYPIESWHQQERGAVHFHGHVHGKSRKIDNRFDVGFESVDFLHGEHELSQLEIDMLADRAERRHATIEGGSKFGI